MAQHKKVNIKVFGDMIWYDIWWYIWYDIWYIWYDIWYDIYDMIWYMIWYDIVSISKQLPMFLRSLLHHLPALQTHKRCRQQPPLRHRSLFTHPYDVTSKTWIFINTFM